MHYRQNRYQEFSHDTKLVHEQQTNQKAKELNLSLCYTNIKKKLYDKLVFLLPKTHRSVKPDSKSE